MSDLLVTTHTPALGSGRALRTYMLARALADAGGALDLLYVRFGETAPDDAFRAIGGLSLHEAVPRRGTRRLLTYLRARAAGVPHGFARGISPELVTAATRLAAAPDRERVIADGPVAAGALRKLARLRPVIYCAHNLESALRPQLGGTLRAGRVLRAWEARVLATASESWMVSEADVAAARDICPKARVRYVPNVVDCAAVNPVTARARSRTALMVGDFRYAPNRNAVDFLLAEVMPLVWAEVPDACLALAGRGLEDLAPADERVLKLGFVAELGETYAAAACAVVPLLQGGGTPLKFIEAFAHGVPVVATPRAAAGLAVHDGEHYLRAATAAEFAAGVVLLLRDGDDGLGMRGRALAQQRYSLETLTELVAA